MLTYTGSINLYKTLTKNSQTDNITLGDTLIDEGIRKICSSLAWEFSI